MTVSAWINFISPIPDQVVRYSSRIIKRTMLIGFPEKVDQALQYTGRLFISAFYTTSLGILGCANATL